MNITLSQNAIKHIKSMYNKNPEKIIVFSMKQTGCSGFEYSVTLETATNELDIVEHSGLVIGFDKGLSTSLKVPLLITQQINLKVNLCSVTRM